MKNVICSKRLYNIIDDYIDEDDDLKNIIVEISVATINKIVGDELWK